MVFKPSGSQVRTLMKVSLAIAGIWGLGISRDAISKIMSTQLFMGVDVGTIYGILALYLVWMMHSRNA